jgi:hypothetical protein
MPSIAKQFADLMGGTVKFECDTWFQIDLPEGKGLSVHDEGKNWSIVTQWPMDANRHHHAPPNHPKIGVSKSRGVEALVADVQKRLMPQYNQLWPTYKGECDKWNGYRANQLATARKLAERMGTTLRPSEEDSCEFGRGPLVKKLRVQSNGETVLLETHGVPVATMEKILDLLGKTNEP